MYRLLLLASGLFAPSVALAQSTLLAGWDFQTTLHGGTAVATGSGTPTTLLANFGAQAGEATIYLNGGNGSSVWTSTEYEAGGGSALNAGSGFSTLTDNPAALSLKNSSANGQSITIQLSLVGYANLSLSYATIRTPSGFNSSQWAWSTDGEDFQNWGSMIAPSTSFSTVTLATLTAVNNAESVFLRYTVSGATHSSGNNRLDNIQLTATAIPEPSTYAAILCGVALTGALVYRRRCTRCARQIA